MAGRTRNESQLLKCLLQKNYRKAQKFLEMQMPINMRKAVAKEVRVTYMRECQLYINSCRHIVENNRVDKFICERVHFPALKCESLLYFAVVSNRPFHLKRLLDKGANPDYSFRKTSVLSRAIQLNRFEIVKILISFKAKIKNSLTCAVEYRRHKIARWLLDLGKIRSKQLSAAMCTAISLGDLRMVKLLHENGAIINNKTSLWPAITNSDYGVVHFLLQSGADPNCKLTTPLMQALNLKDKVILNLLIEFKVDVNQQFPNGQFPLFTAVERRVPLEIIEKLLEAKANPHVPPFRKHTLFEYVCKYHNLETIKLFMRHGLFEPTGLIFAAQNIDYRTLIYFLTNVPDLDVNIQDENQSTALEYATKKGCCRNILRLLEMGADINIANRYSEYPIFYCNEEHRCPVPKYFLKLLLLGYKLNEMTLTMSPLLENMEELGATDLIECRQEIEKMKNIIISHYLGKTLFSVLLMRLRQVTKFANNEILSEIYERNEGDFNKEFPNFGFLLNLNFRKGLQRRNMISQARGCLIQYEVPEVLEEKILEYLKNEELKIIIGNKI